MNNLSANGPRHSPRPASDAAGNAGGDICVVVVAHQEQARLGRCLASVRDWVREMVVVVQSADDTTIDIAQRCGARVLVNEWRGYAAQRNFALQQANATWVLQLDADESVSDELRQQILDFVASQPTEDAASFRVLDYFMSTWLQHGETYRSRSVRLVRNGAARWAGGLVHEHLQVRGEIRPLDGHVLHHSNPSTASLNQKLSHYADLFVAQRVARGRTRVSLLDIVLRPAFRFFRTYFLRLGFLDGYAGYVYSRYLSHYTFMRYSRLREYSRSESYRQLVNDILATTDHVGEPRVHGFDRLTGRLTAPRRPTHPDDSDKVGQS